MNYPLVFILMFGAAVLQGCALYWNSKVLNALALLVAGFLLGYHFAHFPTTEMKQFFTSLK